MQLNGISGVGVFGVVILACSAFVTSGVAAIYLVLLLASSNVPVVVKARGAAVVGLGWLLTWIAWVLLIRDCIVS